MCRRCGRELKVKEPGTSSKWRGYIVFVSILTVMLGNILRFSGVSFLYGMLILLCLGVVIMFVVCFVVCRYSKLE